MEDDNFEKLHYWRDKAQCLRNKQGVDNPYPKILPGRLLSRDEQCRRNDRVDFVLGSAISVSRIATIRYSGLLDREQVGGAGDEYTDQQWLGYSKTYYVFILKNK